MKRPLLYLDLNTFVDVIMNRDQKFAAMVRAFCESRAQAVYAPPHIEEIVNVYRSRANDADCDRYVSEQLKGIRELTNCWELLPNNVPNTPGRLVQEDPDICLMRVIDQYENTYIAEGNEEALRDYVLSKQIAPIPSNAFADTKVRSIWQRRMHNRGYDPECYPTKAGLRSSFNLTTQMIDICFRSLHDAGFGLEPRRKTRSTIHDVTHIIYATMADHFISRDDILLQKAKAIFNFLDAECVIYSPDEFAEYVAGLS